MVRLTAGECIANGTARWSNMPGCIDASACIGWLPDGSGDCNRGCSRKLRAASSCSFISAISLILLLLPLSLLNSASTMSTSPRNVQSSTPSFEMYSLACSLNSSESDCSLATVHTSPRTATAKLLPHWTPRWHTQSKSQSALWQQSLLVEAAYRALLMHAAIER